MITSLVMSKASISQRLPPLMLVFSVAIGALSSCTQTHPTAGLFIESQVSLRQFMAASDVEKVLVGLSMVADFCTNSQDAGVSPSPPADFSSPCNGPCGVQASYLNEFLMAWGFEARLLNLYNVPFQGNHTVVEVNLGGKWRLLDPTFGLFFLDGQELATTARVVGGDGLAGRAADLGSSKELLSGGGGFHAFLPPDAEELGSKFWSEDSYSKAEEVVPVGLDPLQDIDLQIFVPLGGGFPEETCVALDSECDSIWLEETNATLLNSSMADNVSFLARNVGVYEPYFVNSPTIKLHPTLPEGLYNKGQDVSLSILWDRQVTVIHDSGTEQNRPPNGLQRSPISVVSKGPLNSTTITASLEALAEVGVQVSLGPGSSGVILQVSAELIE